MNLLVSGSRSFPSSEFWRMEGALFEELEAGPIDLIISGGAKGADTWAIYFADRAKIPRQIMHADWATHGKAAGIIRNKEMAKLGDKLIAFWDGQSRGTEQMIAEMTRLKKPIRVVNFRTVIY